MPAWLGDRAFACACEEYLLKPFLHSQHAFVGQGPICCAQLDNIRDDIISIVTCVEASQADHLGVQRISLPSHQGLQLVLALTTYNSTGVKKAPL